MKKNTAGRVALKPLVVASFKAAGRRVRSSAPEECAILERASTSQVPPVKRFHERARTPRPLRRVRGFGERARMKAIHDVHDSA